MTTDTMRAMVLDECGGTFRAENRPVPDPGPGEVLVDVGACGVGLTLEHGRKGLLGGTTPRVLGHELAGTIVGWARSVVQWTSGQRVTASFYLLCGNCDMCASGRESLCRNNGGYYGMAVDGAFAERASCRCTASSRCRTACDLRRRGVVADAVATPYHVASQRRGAARPERRGDRRRAAGSACTWSRSPRVRCQVIGVERDPRKLAELAEAGTATSPSTPATRTPGPSDLERPPAVGWTPWSTWSRVNRRSTGPSARWAGPARTWSSASSRTRRCVVAPNRVLHDELVITGNRYATRAEIARSLDLVAAGRVRPSSASRWRWRT